jgi:hypothetical protein
VIARGDEESPSFVQVKEDYSLKGLTDGWELRPVIETEKVNSIVTVKTKSLKLPERLTNLRITYSDDGHAGRTNREAKESR